MAGSIFGNPEPDILGRGYEAFTADLPDDAEGPVVATLVRHRARVPTNRAVLYLHGLSDYFHQVELAEFHAARGETFYALDLRKNGRSLRPHQTACRMADVSDYHPELDAALEFIRDDGHDHVVLNAHSTGGLIGLMWLHGRRERVGTLDPIAAIVLNGPFLDVPASWALRTLAPRPFAVLAKNRPLLVLPAPERSLYQMSIHRSERGEWDFVTAWKPISGGAVRAEWLAAAQRAIAQAHAGLGLACPILVLCSARTIRAKQWTDELYLGDAVLDSDSTARWSTRLGNHVTCIRITDGMHDLLLSRPHVRQTVFAEIDRWMNAYARTADHRFATNAADPPAAEISSADRR